MIDCHCHMLPGIDDGSKELQQSLRMATVAVESGVTEILLTPHHNDGMYFNLCEDIVKGVENFQSELDEAAIALKVHPGSECHVVPELPEHLQSGIACTYANRQRAVLLELPKHTLPTGAEAIIEQVAYLGLQPVIAHPERNAILCQQPDRLEDWFERGWTFQLTNQSCSGQFGEDIQDTCYYWLERGWIHFIASDAHRSKGRSPDMRKGVEQIEQWFGKSAAELLSHDNPARLIKGESIHNMPATFSKKKTRKRRGFRFWR
jgi:protein-tyrosine phosphatase